MQISCDDKSIDENRATDLFLTMRMVISFVQPTIYMYNLISMISKIFTRASVGCDRGDMHPALWGYTVGNSWRTTNDISDTWER